MSNRSQVWASRLASDSEKARCLENPLRVGHSALTWPQVCVCVFCACLWGYPYATDNAHFAKRRPARPEREERMLTPSSLNFSPHNTVHLLSSCLFNIVLILLQTIAQTFSVSLLSFLDLRLSVFVLFSRLLAEAQLMVFSLTSPLVTDRSAQGRERNLQLT